MEKLLNRNDINEILSNNRNNPVFKYQGVRLMATEKHSFKEVVAISNKHNLILIKGNEDTGNLHIRERHNFWSTKKYIIPNEKGEPVFQNQSRFPQDVAPIKFLEIADIIYSKENKIENNDHPMSDKFDLFIGEYEFEKDKKERVKLLLYKNTTIVHSLFLASSKYNKKKVKGFKFTRGKVQFKFKKDKNVEETFIPYYDVELKLRYGISIEKYPKINSEIIYLLVFDTKDYSHHNFLKLLERELTFFKSRKSEEITYQHCDLREVERFMMKVDKDIENGNFKLGPR